MGNTTYFSVSYTDVTALLPDTSLGQTAIEVIAQAEEDRVMDILGISASPGSKRGSVIKTIIINYTCAKIEAREPHSFQDGSFSQQKFARMDFRREADEELLRIMRYFDHG